MLACGILQGFAVHVIFVLLQRVISEDGRLHRFVRGVCSVQSSSLRCVRCLWQGRHSIFQAKYSAAASAVVWNEDLWFLFFFLVPRLPRWWSRQWLILTPRSAPGKVLCLHGSWSLAPHHPCSGCRGVLFQRPPVPACLLVLVVPVP